MPVRLVTLVVVVLTGLCLSASAQAGTIDQQQTATSPFLTSSVTGPMANGAGVKQTYAQTFTAGSSGVLDLVEVRVRGDLVSENPLVAQLRTVSADGNPGATVLSEVDVAPQAIADTPTTVPLRFTAFVVSGTPYAIVLQASGSDTYQLSGVTGDPYAAGSVRVTVDPAAGGAWGPGTGDLTFATFVHRGAVQRFTTPGCSTFVVPPGVQQVRAWSTGAAGESQVGGRPGGRGDGISATLAGVQGGQPLRVCVAEGGGVGGDGFTTTKGGGASGIAVGADFSAPRIVAGGGGGGGQHTNNTGGDAGLPEGAQAGAATSLDGGGGTQTGPGAGGRFGVATSGTGSSGAGPGRGGQGDSTTGGLGSGGGGGGAGFFGGGGGSFGSGGGGGSSTCAAQVVDCERYPAQGVATTAGGAVGQAQVTLMFTVPGAPIVLVTSPARGASFAQGEPARSSFTCAEGPDGPGLASCLDDAGRASGATLDTSTPGDRVLRITATSTNGLTTTQDAAYTVRPTPPAAPGPPALSLTAVTQRSSRWARRGKARRGRPLGTAFTFTTNRAGTAVLAFSRDLPGRRAGGRCVAPTARLSRAGACRRLVAAGTLRRNVPPGHTTLAFRGAITQMKRLPPGRYSVGVRIEAGGATSRTVQLRFTILR